VVGDGVEEDFSGQNLLGKSARPWGSFYRALDGVLGLGSKLPKLGKLAGERNPKIP
jgi:hypothetical protein